MPPRETTDTKTNFGVGVDHATPSSSTFEGRQRPFLTNENDIFAVLDGIVPCRRHSNKESQVGASAPNSSDAKETDSKTTTTSTTTRFKYTFVSDASAARMVTLHDDNDDDGGVVKVSPKGMVSALTRYEPDLELQFDTPADFVNLWNDKVSGKELANQGKLRLRGTKPAARTLVTIMEEARNISASKVHDSLASHYNETREMEEDPLLEAGEAEGQQNKWNASETQHFHSVVGKLDFFCQFGIAMLCFASIGVYWMVLSWGFAFFGSLVDVGDFSSYLLLLKYSMASVPLVHHWYYNGLAYRRLQVFAVAFTFLYRVRMIRKRAERLLASEGNVLSGVDIWDFEYEITARFLHTSIFRIRGLWTKAAQYLGSRADVSPTAFIRELCKLQDAAPSTPWKTVKAILKRQGVYPFLAEMDKTPIASASIGQVHTARLAKGGERVVVKVQHPHARRLLTDDFWSLLVICDIVAWLEPECKFLVRIMKEWATAAQDELDFRCEGRNLQTAHEAANEFAKTCQPLRTNPSTACPQSIPFSLDVPRPYSEWTSRDVLVMSFCQGKRVDDLDHLREQGLSKDAVVDALCQSFAFMMFASPIFNADPHPGNLLVRANPNDGGFTIVILDWGLAKRIPDEKRKGFCQLACAATNVDFGLLLDSFESLELKTKKEDMAVSMERIRFVLRDLAPRKAAKRMYQSREKTEKDRGFTPAQSKAHLGAFFFFARTNELLHGLGAKMEVESPFMEVIRPYAELGLAGFLEEEAKQLQPLVSSPPSRSSDSIDNDLTSKLRKVVADLDKTGDVAGAQLCVLNQSGDTIVNSVYGHMGSTKKSLPMTKDAVMVGFSVTKAISATLAHVMVQEGYLDYDEPLCERVWPAFCPFEEPPEEFRRNSSSVENLDQRWKWKRGITLGHVLAHTAGLARAFPQNLSFHSVTSCELCAEGYEYDNEGKTVLPTTAPGAETAYHFLSFGWLVAGAIIGAYRVRHNKQVTFEELYNLFLKPKLPESVLHGGFYPCGGVGHHPKALCHVDFSANVLTQVQREAESMGELTLDGGEIDASSLTHSDEEKAAEEASETSKPKLDQNVAGDARLFNCTYAEAANVPSAGGRFSAMAIAEFFRALGTGQIIRPALLDKASHLDDGKELTPLAELQQQGLTNNNNTTTTTMGTELKGGFGLGYQIFELDGQQVYGHTGMNGSVGFYHAETGSSIGIMLNKCDADPYHVTMKMMEVLVDYFKAQKTQESTKREEPSLLERFVQGDFMQVFKKD